jgi:hypothetical protein
MGIATGMTIAAGRTSHKVGYSVKSAQFEAILDKLVAVQMDLRPICGLGTTSVPIVAARASIADACDILHSAIADIRNIIDGLMDLPEALAANEDGGGFAMSRLGASGWSVHGSE